MIAWSVGPLVVLLVFLGKWFTGRRSEAVSWLSRELAEVLLAVSIVVALEPLLSMAGPGLFDSAKSTIDRSIASLSAFLDRLLDLSKAVAVLDVVLGIVFAEAGSSTAPTVVVGYQTSMHAALGPLELLATSTGLALALLRGLLTVLNFSPSFQGLLVSLTPTLLVPRVRRLTLPVWFVAFILAVLIPTAVQTYTLSLQPLSVRIPVESNIGVVKFHVEDVSATPIFKPDVLVALRDDEGHVYVTRIREGSAVLLPIGNYTALWLVHYWTNFTLHACCYSPREYSSCNCYVWPAVFQVKEGYTTDVQVWLPVEPIEEGNGHSGHVLAYVGDSIVRSNKGEGYVTYSFSLHELKRGVTVLVRGGPYRVQYSPNLGGCKPNITVSGGKPPGKLIDPSWLRQAREAYKKWLQRVARGISVNGDVPLNLTETPIPGFSEYALHISIAHCDFTEGNATVNLNLTIWGIAQWNATTAPTYISSWDPVTRFTAWITENVVEVLNPIAQLFGIVMTLLITASALLSFAGVSAFYLSDWAKALLPHPRSLIKPPLLSWAKKVLDRERREDEERWIENHLDDPTRVNEVENLFKKKRGSTFSKRTDRGLFEVTVSEREARRKSSRVKKLLNMYLRSRKGLRALEGPVRLVVKEKLPQLPLKLHIMYHAIRGYRRFSYRQLNFEAADNYIMTLDRDLYTRILTTYKQLALNDLRSSSRNQEDVSRLIKLIENAETLSEVDTGVIYATGFDHELYLSLLKRYKIYEEPIFSRKALLLNYRLQALKRLGSGENVKWARELYLNFRRASEKDSPGLEGSR